MNRMTSAYTFHTASADVETTRAALLDAGHIIADTGERSVTVRFSGDDAALTAARVIPAPLTGVTTGLGIHKREVVTA